MSQPQKINQPNLSPSPCIKGESIERSFNSQLQQWSEAKYINLSINCIWGKIAEINKNKTNPAINSEEELREKIITKLGCDKWENLYKPILDSKPLVDIDSDPMRKKLNLSYLRKLYLYCCYKLLTQQVASASFHIDDHLFGNSGKAINGVFWDSIFAYKVLGDIERFVKGKFFNIVNSTITELNKSNNQEWKQKFREGKTYKDNEWKNFEDYIRKNIAKEAEFESIYLNYNAKFERGEKDKLIKLDIVISFNTAIGETYNRTSMPGQVQDLKASVLFSWEGGSVKLYKCQFYPFALNRNYNADLIIPNELFIIKLMTEGIDNNAMGRRIDDTFIRIELPQGNELIKKPDLEYIQFLLNSMYGDYNFNKCIK